ncbi:MAG TPA: PQQ-dependent sugar dehydrogenase [Solirubrobacterales bacterium]|nr:PQQ-dependent sugar dehydrogenase [Solirubrobacterales bacterium]
MSRRGLGAARLVVALLCAAIVGMLVPSGAGASTLPAGFEETTVLPGVGKPQDIAIAPNGRVFVAEKTGFIRTYSSVDDTTPTLFADLRTKVHNFGSRGLLSIVTDPKFGTTGNNYVYVYYTMDAPLGGTPPVYGGGSFDACPETFDAQDGDLDKPGIQTIGWVDNCPVGSRISRLQVAGEVITGSEKVLVEDFCQQFAGHGGGGLAFDKDGKLIASASDGSTSQFWDWGQSGSPKNPCGDPPGGVGASLTRPSSEGGRLRAQDVRTTSDATGLSGSVIRIDPATGAPVQTNGTDANAKRIIAYGLRDATRLAIRPGTNDIWVADRGGGYWEEFHRVTPSSTKLNFGWPCYENDAKREQSDLQNLHMCENLYSDKLNLRAPFWAYDHELEIHPEENCTGNDARPGSTLSGLEFYPEAGGNFPPMYRNALFFADRLRNCIWALLPDANGIPKKGGVVPFAGMAMRATDLEVTPSGDLLYIDQSTDTIQRIRYTVVNQAPVAVPSANVTSGKAPLAVTFSGLGSTDANNDALTYAWDLDGDNFLDDSTAAQPAFTYTTPGTYTVTLKVTDPSGAFSTADLVITVTDNTVVDPGPGPGPGTGTPAPKTTTPTTTPSVNLPSAGPTGPVLIVAAARTQHLTGHRSIEVHGGCVAACTLKATAKVSLPGASKTLKLRGTSAKAAQGKVVTLRIKLKGKKMRAIRRALRRGKKVTATVTVVATDGTGASSAKRKIRLKL